MTMGPDQKELRCVNINTFELQEIADMLICNFGTSLLKYLSLLIGYKP